MIYINRLITKTLIAIIIILLCLIFSNYSDSFKKSYDKYYKNNNIRFNKGLKIYEKIIGKPIFLKEEGLSSQVIELSNNYELEKTMRFSNIAGALSVKKIGSKMSIPEIDEVREIYNDNI